MDYDILQDYAGMDAIEQPYGMCKYTCPLHGCELYGWDYTIMCDVR